MDIDHQSDMSAILHHTADLGALKAVKYSVDKEYSMAQEKAESWASMAKMFPSVEAIRQQHLSQLRNEAQALDTRVEEESQRLTERATEVEGQLAAMAAGRNAAEVASLKNETKREMGFQDETIRHLQDGINALGQRVQKLGTSQHSNPASHSRPASRGIDPEALQDVEARVEEQNQIITSVTETLELHKQVRNDLQDGIDKLNDAVSKLQNLDKMTTGPQLTLLRSDLNAVTENLNSYMDDVPQAVRAELDQLDSRVITTPLFDALKAEVSQLRDVLQAVATRTATVEGARIQLDKMESAINAYGQRIDAVETLRAAFGSLEMRYNNINTNGMTQQMVQQMSAMFPLAANIEAFAKDTNDWRHKVEAKLKKMDGGGSGEEK
ncbi:hypothetical protein K402DRAFT_390367 [Aulographum hederae CBS 113979]|uniref:Uncharacterized protein n=1 Tax=Aulographum hederae CBS 113979 TaxID=1176131 RepID=A0A6G1HAK4_9PEZI|nr:hypothetical protein K402DRAFT_390367 [Aulographum hederae CBS 113979]